MFDQIGNMPLHPLVLHAAVVGIPLAVLLAFLFVFPKTRAWARWAFGLTVLGATAATFVSKESGEAFQQMRNLQPGTSAAADLIQKHGQLADQLFIIMIIFSVIGVANVLLVSRGSSATEHPRGAANGRRDPARAARGDRRDRNDLGDPGRRSGFSGGLESERHGVLHHSAPLNDRQPPFAHHGEIRRPAGRLAGVVNRPETGGSSDPMSRRAR